MPAAFRRHFQNRRRPPTAAGDRDAARGRARTPASNDGRRPQSVTGAWRSRSVKRSAPATTPRITRPPALSSTIARLTATDGSNAAPAAIAPARSAQSTSRRTSARPHRPPGYRPSMTTPCSPVTRMPCTGSPRSSIDAERPRRRSSASAPGLSVSPHSLSRGNAARSIRRTRAPARASTVAATAPAGPAPDDQGRQHSSSGLFFHGQPHALARLPAVPFEASIALPDRLAVCLGAADDQRAVLRSEAEAVAQRGFDLGRAPVVGDEVEIARRIAIVAG